MKFKIIDTTDGKYEGETFEAEGIAPVGAEIVHKGTKFKIEEIKAKGNIVIFFCTNYMVITKVIG
jgi:hypothetical protein